MPPVNPVNTVTAENAAEVAKTVKGGAVVGPATVRRSPSIAALAGAMLAAQQEMENPARTSDNAYFESKYADLAEVRAAVLPALLRAGLVVLQMPCHLDGLPALQTLLVHAQSGEWLETTIGLHAGKTTPQAVGSALTYARRYALQSVCGVAAEDDDGNEASRPAPAEKPRQDARPAPDEALKPWRQWLASPLDLAAFNDGLAQDFKEVPGEARKEVWALVCAEADRRGWAFDPARKHFIEKPKAREKVTA